jgi:6-pyruvoyltetrahydropterin/6-carboxytetrahydropterin synthase
MYELTVEAQFDSAHCLRGYEGPCENLHGHTYRVMIAYQGSELDHLGTLVDFKRLKKELGEVVASLDHQYLNDLPQFREQNPTAENLARFVFEEMRKRLGGGIKRSTVWETPTSAASYWE